MVAWENSKGGSRQPLNNNSIGSPIVSTPSTQVTNRRNSKNFELENRLIKDVVQQNVNGIVLAKGRLLGGEARPKY